MRCIPRDPDEVRAGIAGLPGILQATMTRLVCAIAICLSAGGASGQSNEAAWLDRFRQASARADTLELRELGEQAWRSGSPNDRRLSLLARIASAYRNDEFLLCSSLCDSLLRADPDAGPVRAIASRFRSMVSTHFRNGPEATREAEAGLQGLDSAAHPIEAVDLLVVLAEAHLEEGNSEMALAALRRADALANAANYDRGMAMVDFTLGVINWMQGRHDSAQRHFRSALRSAALGGHDVLARNAASNLAAAAAGTGDYDAAGRMLDSLMLSLGQSNPSTRAALLMNQAHIALAEGRSDAAVKHCERALSISDSIGYVNGKVAALRLLASISAEQDDGHAAMRTLEQGLALAERHRMHVDAAAILQSMHDISTEMGDDRSALRYLTAYSRISDSLNAARLEERIAYAQVRFETERKDRLIAEQDQHLHLAAAEARRKALQRNLSAALALLSLAAAVFLWRSLVARKRLAAKEHELHLYQVDQLFAEHQARSAEMLAHAQEHTRKRIAANLHDQMGGTFATIRLQVEGLEARVPAIAGDAQFAQVKRQIAGAGEELRKLSHELAEGPLADHGLERALIELRDSIANSGMVEVELRTKGLEQRMTRQEEEAAYRLVQELVTNALKHASASRITIDLVRHPDELVLSVADDGSGFDVKKAGGGLGLGNLRSRVQEQGGELRWESAPGKGAKAIARLRIRS